jgi:hypothetical protein
MVTIPKCVRRTRNIDKLCVLYVQFHHTVEELLSCFSPPFLLLILYLSLPAITLTRTYERKANKNTQNFSPLPLAPVPWTKTSLRCDIRTWNWFSIAQHATSLNECSQTSKRYYSTTVYLSITITLNTYSPQHGLASYSRVAPSPLL